jgi:diguanylate cyclase (GGDEF)-like protein
MAYQLRDRHGATRAVAYLMLAAAPFVFVTGVVLTPHRPLPALFAVSVTCVAIAIAAVVCWARPQMVPDFFFLIAPLLAAVVITGMNLVTEDASTGAQLFYLWPVLYAASFLSRPFIYVNLFVVSAGEASVVFLLQAPGHALGDWGAMSLAVTMSAVVVVSLRDRADQLNGVLETQALADALTGLANRRSFDEALTRAAAWAWRNEGRLALLTVDVDHFKRINDTWGHAVGDRALQAVSAALTQVAGGDDDLVARMGGDEFVMLLRGDEARALRTAEALRAAVAAISDLPGGPPSLSIGVAILPDDADSVEGLVNASDAALYDAKTGGRGRVAMASDSTAYRHNLDAGRTVRQAPETAPDLARRLIS